jgi:hypothetical protein
MRAFTSGSTLPVYYGVIVFSLKKKALILQQKLIHWLKYITVLP